MRALERSGFFAVFSACAGAVLSVGVIISALGVAAPAAVAQSASGKTSSGATLGGFAVYGRAGIRQGKSTAQIVEDLKNSGRRCAQELVPSIHDPSIQVITSCGKPEVYLSFCNDELYWASVTRKGGFSNMVNAMHYFTDGGVAGRHFSASDISTKLQVRNGEEISQDYELSMRMTGKQYHVTMTMFAKRGNIREIENEFRLDYQALINAAQCR